MLTYPKFDPTIIRIGFLQVRWYGVCYLVSIIFGYFFYRKTLLSRGVQMSILGGRLGYVLFYKVLLAASAIFAVWHGGVSRWSLGDLTTCPNFPLSVNIAPPDVATHQQIFMTLSMLKAVACAKFATPPPAKIDLVFPISLGAKKSWLSLFAKKRLPRWLSKRTESIFNSPSRRKHSPAESFPCSHA